MKSNLNLNKALKSLIIILLSVSFLQSCYKDRLKIDKISGGEWNPKLAAPLFYGDLTMKKLVDNSSEIWREDPTGLLSLIYIGDTISELADNVFTIPDQSHDTSITYSLPPGMFPGDSTSKYVLLEPKFTPSSNQRVDSVLIKSGILTVEITTNMNHTSYIEIVIPQLKRFGASGQTFKEKIDIPYTGGSSTTITKQIPLYEYMLSVNPNGSNANTIKEYVKIFVLRGNGSDNSPYTFNINQTMTSMDYYQAYGYFDQHTIDVSKTTIPISLFDNLHYTQIMIEDPKLRLSFKNSYGMPLDMTFSDLHVEKDGIIKDVTSTLLPTMGLNYPDFSHVGYSDTSTFTFDKNNSNIIDIVNFNPKKLVYEGFVLSNPTGVIMPNFVLDTSKVNIRAELEIPLYGRALDFTLNDTSKVDFNSTFNWDQIVSLDLNLNALNYFPVESRLQVYIADSNKTVYDSLFNGESVIVEAAIVGPPPEYRSDVPSHKLTTIKLSNEKLKNFLDASYIIISSKSNTYDSGNKIVKIYSDYKISLELSAKGEYKTDYNL